MADRLTREQLLDADPADLSPWETAWAGYFREHPEVLANFRHQTGRWPADNPNPEA